MLSSTGEPESEEQMSNKLLKAQKVIEEVHRQFMNPVKKKYK